MRYRGPRRSFKERIVTFMYGRYGFDALSKLLWIISLVISVANIFIFHPLTHYILYGISTLLLAFVIFRILSRNIYKRQRENAVYLRIKGKIKGFFSLRRAKFRDRKTHVFKKCPSCKNNLRLPRKKGKHTVNCPCCHTRFDVKI